MEIADDKAIPPTPSDGFFVVNEGRFGKDNRWVNYFKYNNGTYDPSYRVYRVANPGDKLGVTSQFATIWGNHAYFCSNQGNRSGKIYLCITVISNRVCVEKTVHIDITE